MNKSKSVLGVFLILLGIGILASKFAFLNEDMIMLIFAAGFFAMYLLNGGIKIYRNLIFIIPSFILLSMVALDWAQEMILIGQLNESYMMFFIGTAFLLIFLVHTVWFTKLKPIRRLWPLYTSLVLFVLGSLKYATIVTGFDYYKFMFQNLIPIMLIFIGISMIIKSIIKKY